MITSNQLRYIRTAALAFIVLFASTALAQTAPSAGISTTGTNTTTVVTDSTSGTTVNGVSRVSPGSTGQTFGTVQLNATQSTPVQTSSIPLIFTFTGGATPANLSNCQLVNASGAVLNSGTNILNTVASGQNNVTLDAPFVINPGTTQNLSLRCNVASTTPAGSTFQVAVASGAATFAFPPSAASLAVTSTAIPGVQNNTTTMTNVTLGTVRFDATTSGGAVRISSIPVTAATIGSASTLSVSSCQFVDSNGTALNTASGALSTGENNLTLISPLTVSAGTATTLSLRCTVAPGTGGTIVLIPGAGTLLSATAATTGAAVTPTITTVAGTPFLIGGTVAPVDPTVPGVPSTGLGDRTSEIAGILLGIMLLAGGALYLRNRRQLNA